MNELVIGFWIVGSIALLASMSPGPDFAVVMKNSLMHSRKAGLFTALGVGAGIFVHVAYSLLGIGFIVAQSILLFNVIKIAGALYLFYLAYKLLTAKTAVAMGSDATPTKEDIVSIRALQEGFLTNALNPKVTIFFLSVFTQVINPDTSLLILILYGVEIALVVLVWFLALAWLSTTPLVSNRLVKGRFYIEKIFGLLLLILGVKLLLSNR